MKTLGIDLKPLFNSSILFHKIDNQNPNFDEFDRNLKYCIIHSNANSLYDVLYGEKLEFNFVIAHFGLITLLRAAYI